jgi:Domain of unknown function (DUF4268)
VGKHEALDFTTWLQENLDVLNDTVDVSVSTARREQTAGDFSVDLVAEDVAGDLVVIENQLERSDHDHLGKLLTYLVAIGAKTGIWIVADPRPEHVRTISWLNESSSASFYLLKVEAIRIGDSTPAPLLTLILGPSEVTRKVGRTKEEWAERENLRYRFWKALLERSRQRTELHANISPSRDSWISAGAGKSGLGFNYAIRELDARVELYIDRREAEQNKAIFDALAASREDIEERSGEPLVWQKLESRKASRISGMIERGGYREEERWPEIQDAMIDAMIRLEKALRPNLSRLKV